MQKAGITSAKEWVATFDEPLVGPAEAWRDFVILSHPGRGRYSAALRRNATDMDCRGYQRFIRADLMKKTGLDTENPGLLTKKRW